MGLGSPVAEPLPTVPAVSELTPVRVPTSAVGSVPAAVPAVFPPEAVLLPRLAASAMPAARPTTITTPTMIQLVRVLPPGRGGGRLLNGHLPGRGHRGPSGREGGTGRPRRRH